MKSLTRLAFAAVLAASALSLPSSASAQSARGTFNLTHEVTWQSSVVPAGEYEFSLEPGGATVLLTLRPRSGNGPGFILLVNSTGRSTSSDLNRILLVSRAGKSFVSALELSNFGTTLRFTVPPESAGKELALAGGPTPTP